MRKGQDCDFIYGDNQQIIGLCLGADFCSEHEWGFDGIKRDFGMPVVETERPFASWWKNLLNIKPVMGADKRSITKCPENLLKGEGSVEWTDYSVKPKKKEKLKVYYIGYKPYFYSDDKSKLFKDNLKQIWDGNKQVWGWWGEGDFMVASTNKEVIDQIYQAFQDKDLIILLGGGHAFKNSGLTFIQKSKISEENIKFLYDQDFDSWELKQAAVKTGIYDRLEKANKKFYALSPRWKDKDNKKDVVFWLNPEEQQKNNSGWYSVEDLDLWAKNEGPIVMSKDKVK
jgi:hypothetical protein